MTLIVPAASAQLAGCAQAPPPVQDLPPGSTPAEVIDYATAQAQYRSVSRPVYLVDFGVPGAVHGRHDPDQHDRQHLDARRLWLGLFKPIRKLYYNLTVTAVSVVVAVVVGGLETLNLIGAQLGLIDAGGFWERSGR